MSLSVIFDFTLCQPNIAYSVKNLDQSKLRIIEELAELGLVFFYRNNAVSYFIISDLLNSFLLSNKPQSN